MMNIIRKYWDSVYIYVLLLMPGFCACAGIFWTVCKLYGLYPGLQWTQILAFDGSQVIYFIVGIFYIYKNKKDSSYIPEHLLYVKGFIVLALFIQYNFILYLFPSVHVWECTFLFFAIIVFLFDSKLMLVNILAYLGSLVVAHVTKPDKFLALYDAGWKEALAFRIIIYGLTSLCIFVIVYFVERFLMQAQESSEENVQLLEKQVKYYRDIELMDTELRKFRHDIISHFLCMEYLFKNEKKEELDKYFQDLKQSFSFQEKMYASGNDIIDAVLNHDLHSNCKKEVEITVYGSLPKINTISAMDLCTVFSNLLSNAVTSANQAAENFQSQLIVQFLCGSTYFSISITNSISEQYMEKKYKKKDRDHGFGMYKIKAVVDKYKGSFEQNVESQMVTTTVYFPI